MGVGKYFWAISRPGNRAGWEVWLGPVGLSLTVPPRWPVIWNWGWWRVATRTP